MWRSLISGLDFEFGFSCMQLIISWWFLLEEAEFKASLFIRCVRVLSIPLMGFENLKLILFNFHCSNCIFDPHCANLRFWQLKCLWWCLALYTCIPNFAEIRVLRCNSSKVLTKPKFRNNLVRLDGQESSLLVYPKHKSRFRVNATAGQPEAFDPKSKRNSFRDSLDVFYRFSRPHTVIGTVRFLLRNVSLLTAIFRVYKKITSALWLDLQVLSILSVSFLAVEKVSDISPLLFTGILEVMNIQHVMTDREDTFFVSLFKQLGFVVRLLLQLSWWTFT